MRTRTLILGALAVTAPLLVASKPNAIKLTFSPAAGSSLTKTFSNSVEFALDDMTMLMNGEENPMMPQIEMDMAMESTVSVTDTYDSISRGKPTKLTRTFDEISTEMDISMVVDAMGQVQEENPTGSGSSDLEGETVVFTWDADDDEYVVSFPEDEGDDDLLENLVEDMDLRALLPKDEVSEGDSWDLPLVSLIDILGPGGDLKLDFNMDGQEVSGGPPPEMMVNFREMMGDMLDGEATATFAGMTEVDGVSLAVIEIEIEIDTAKDMSELIEELVGEELPEGMDFNLDRVDVEFAYEASGQCLWNVRAGHAHSLSLEGEAVIALDMEVNMDFGGQSMAMEMSMEMSGEMTTEMETE
jgi:hypothetical protein